MRDIRIEVLDEPQRVDLKTIERLGWGLLLIWVGVAILANIGWAGGLLGAGVILLGAQAARLYFDLRTDTFGVLLGLCFAVAGFSRLLDLQLDKAPISAWLVPSLFILAGVAALLSAWRHRPRA